MKYHSINPHASTYVTNAIQLTERYRVRLGFLQLRVEQAQGQLHTIEEEKRQLKAELDRDSKSMFTRFSQNQAPGVRQPDPELLIPDVFPTNTTLHIPQPFETIIPGPLGEEASQLHSPLPTQPAQASAFKLQGGACQILDSRGNALASQPRTKNGPQFASRRLINLKVTPVHTLLYQKSNIHRPFVNQLLRRDVIPQLDPLSSNTRQPPPSCPHPTDSPSIPIPIPIHILVKITPHRDSGINPPPRHPPST